MIFRHFLLLLIFIGLIFRSPAQISHGGIPASFSSLKKVLFNIPVIEMEPVDNKQLLEEEKEEKSDSRHLRPFRFAKSFAVDIDPAKSGRWDKSSGQQIWRVGIRSKGAYSLNLIFDKMILPVGASLFIYTPDQTKVLGAFTSDNEQSSGYFTFYPVPGDEIVVEYNEPKEVSYKGQIHISAVNHDYKNGFGSRPLGEAGPCNRDVYCPDVTAYGKEKQAVVDIIVRGQELCTGTIVNNARQDKTPYMITAGHCISNTSDAQQTLVCFNYESPYCGNGQSSLNGYVDQSLNGTILRARSDSLDFALVVLETPPPAEFRPFYSGWNNTGSIPASTFSIHHPKGDVKKISVDNNPPTISNFSSEFIPNSFWRIGKWEAGATESGSSGGPLFNEEKLMVGTLTGGTSTCDDPTDDLFCMFSKQWNYYSSANRQLKVWLDPDNSGIQKISSLNPFDTSVSCDLFSNMIPGESYTLLKAGNPNGGYVSGHNYLKITNYAEKFEQTKQTLISAVSMGIAKSESPSDNENSIVKIQILDEDTITGLPGEELISMDLPINLLSPDRMNFITLDNPMVIEGKYFAGYEINYLNPTDTFAVFHSPNRMQVTKNKAFAKENGLWKPIYAIPAIAESVSLLIDSHGCESILADGTIPPGPEGNKFQVLYPQSGISDHVYLKNNGAEEYVKVILYDISGKKLFIRELNVTATPQIVSMENYTTGIYFLTVDSSAGNQVIKIRINKQR